MLTSRQVQSKTEIAKLSKPEFTQSVKQGVSHHCSLQIQNSIYNEKESKGTCQCQQTRRLAPRQRPDRTSLCISNVHARESKSDPCIYEAQQVINCARHSGWQNTALVAPNFDKTERSKRSTYAQGNRALSALKNLKERVVLVRGGQAMTPG